MEVAFLWFALSVVAGIVAAARGRSGIGYFFVALFFTPVVGLILAIALPRIETRAIEREGDDLRACPECAEPIRREARRCKHCGSSVEPLPKPPSAADQSGRDFGRNWFAGRHNR